MITLNYLEIWATVFETLLLFLFLNQRHIIRKNGLIYVIYLISGILLDFFASASYLSTVILLIELVLLIKIFFKFQWFKCLYMTSIFFMILALAEVIALVLVMIIYRIYSLDIILDNYYLKFQAIIISKMLSMIVILVCRNILGRIKYCMNTIERIMIYLPIAFNTILILLVFFKLNSLHSSSDASFLLYISLFVTLEIICSLIIIQFYISERVEKIEFEKSQNKLNKEAEFYKSKLKNEADMSKLYHDLNNYTIYIKQALENSSTPPNDIQELFQPLKKYEMFLETGNRTLTLLLNEKMHICSDKQIPIDCAVDFRRGNFIRPIDLCVIFGNALDNAIEACEKIVNPSNRNITIRAGEIESFLSIKITNSVTNNIEIGDDNTIQTTKTNRTEHGIGLKSIYETLLKYEGELNLTCCNYVFALTIIVPIS